MRLPRVVVAAPASGHGKTTVATGLMAALRRAGHEVSGHKIGPDYIDPGYHALATGRPGRNLDPHLVGPDRLVPLLRHGATTPRPADIAIVEGVMGLFDGAIGRDGFASTAHVAGVIDAPVLLVVDVSASARTVGAVVFGLRGFDPAIRVAGVILNKAGSARHAAEARTAVEGIGVPVLGVLFRDDGISAPSRHLGLVPVAERDDARVTLDRLAAQIAERVDLAAVVRIARSAPGLPGADWDPVTAVVPAPGPTGGVSAGPVAGPGGQPVVAVAGGRAFTFRYAETEELLAAAGCRPVVFDPLAAESLPAGTAALYRGGGFPVVHAADLAGNAPLRADIAARIDAGLPTVAECAGLLYLCREVDGAPMLGVVDAVATMTSRLTLGYRAAVAGGPSVLAPAGTPVTGHEFHRTTVSPLAGPDPAWLIGGAGHGFALDPARTGRATVHASYLHTHWAGSPALAARLAAAARRYADPAPGPGVSRGTAGLPSTPTRTAAAPTPTPTRTPVAPTRAPAGLASVADAEPDLHHHGDAEAGPGLLDFAVNVRAQRPPDWLARRIAGTLDTLGRYPDATAATAAIAARHGRPVDQVLPTAGGAEAFTLIARALRPVHAVVVHPQFTEPEAALRAAGHAVERVVLAAADGFVLPPGAIPDAADLVMIGNPTNPTGVLHPAAELRPLLRPGRVLVVDEAFLDAVPGEAESLAGQQLPGLLVVRSLTKTWALAGLRAGYAVGDGELTGRRAAQQPPWSVSAPALAAIAACCAPEAIARAAAELPTIAAGRYRLVRGLAALGLPVAGAPATPFVLVDTTPALPAGAPPGLMRDDLRRRGIAVRRGDTFPGLGPAWIRIAVRDPATTDRLLAALQELIMGTRPFRGTDNGLHSMINRGTVGR
ncbi:Rv2231c family pyridoxal phosphate-dependent protein CobC [Nakamurella sp.]|uniref:Rv2231c family pyridoxal phosphate-dependent protein CobC n=1 Tax=Nakamurella sp. TaxID=1869182 RepID=UPI003B3A4ABC